MEVILTQDIPGLGYKNDIVKVKGGYGRNYLIPQGLAIVASNMNKKVLEENVRQAAHKAEKIKADAEELAGKLGELEIELGAKAGEKGKIFGAITQLQIADALKEKGFEIDKRRISFKTPVKELGDYQVEVDLHKEVKPNLKIKVVAE